LAIGIYGRIDVPYNLAGPSYFNWLEDVTDEERNPHSASLAATTGIAKRPGHRPSSSCRLRGC